MEVKGKIKLVMEAQSFDSGFTKREFVITTDEKYPQDIKMELIKENCSKIDAFKVNDTINCSINLRGNEYNGKYYVNIQCWKIEQGESGEPNLVPEAVESDDLPF